MEHDELCGECDPYDRYCHCAQLACARADERERWGLGWVAAADNVQALAHAEAVSAQLVEVICERDERVGYWHRRWDFANGQMDAMGASLLAARAEVAALRATLKAEVDALSGRAGMWDDAINAVLDVIDGDA